MEPKTTLIFDIDAAVAEQLSVFQHKHRFPARTSALRWLLGWALHAEPRPTAADVSRAARRSPGRPRTRKEEQDA